MTDPVVDIRVSRSERVDIGYLLTGLRRIANDVQLTLALPGCCDNPDAIILYCDSLPEEAPTGRRLVVIVVHGSLDVSCPDWADHLIEGRGENGLKWALRFLSQQFYTPACRLSYGAASENHMWFTPAWQGNSAAEQVPYLVVLVHGGFWERGVACDHMAPLAGHLSRQGLSVVNLEYQRGGDWAVSVGDIARALVWLARSSRDGKMNAQRIVCIGHSSGAHLMHLALGQTTELIQPRLLISLAGLLDLEAAREHSGCCDALARARARSFAALPDPALYPITTPVLAVHGTKDSTVPSNQPARFRDRYEGSCLTLFVDECDHMDLIKPEGAHWPQLIDTIRLAVQ